MLGSVTSDSQEFDNEDKSAATAVVAAASGLQERLMGRGAFRRFVELRAARGTELSLACGSPSFTAAAAGILRYLIDSLFEHSKHFEFQAGSCHAVMNAVFPGNPRSGRSNGTLTND